MTIRLLTDWPYTLPSGDGTVSMPAGSVVGVFNAATEAGMIAAGIALATNDAANWVPPSEAKTSLSAQQIALIQSAVPEAGIPPVTGTENQLVGSAGSPSLTGAGNVTLGNRAGEALTVGNSNTLIGNKAGLNLSGSGDGNTVGALNTLIGADAGGNLTTGSSNVMIGQKAGVGGVTSAAMVCIGKSAAAQISLGAVHCVYIGQASGEFADTTGQSNISIGTQSSHHLSGASQNNIFIGRSAGAGTASNKNTGSDNTAVGHVAGQRLTTAVNNTLMGRDSGVNLTTGSANVFIGRGSGASGVADRGSTAIGTYAGEFNTGSRNILLGFGARTVVGTENAFVAGSVGNTGGADIASILNVYFGNGMVAPAPVGYTVNGTGGSGTNIAGGLVRIAGGRGTGAAESGKVVLAAAPAGSSGAAANALVDYLELLGEGFFFIRNASTVPGSNPTNGGNLYVESGALKYRGSSGTITTIAPA